MTNEGTRSPREELIYQIELKRDLRLHNGIDYVAWEALRAVVELHKPVVSPLYGDTVCTCTPTGDFQYPCPTIQAIEKELK